MPVYLGFDVGSNSVGSAWVDTDTGQITTGTSIFPAGVDESDDKRGDPKNSKRRMARRTRITLARRAKRKCELRLKLIEAGLLPRTAEEFQRLVETTDPWELRRRGLDAALSPFEFGRVLLHLAQRRGALGLKIVDAENDEEAGNDEEGRVKAAIGEVRSKMRDRSARTFGEYMAMVQAERTYAITTEDRRMYERRKGERVYRAAIRNKAGNYEHCADRQMIHDEFVQLWKQQQTIGGQTGVLLTEELRLALDNPEGDAIWRHQGLLFGQRRQSWDLGTLGRCVLEPTERCVPHADMYASRFLIVETVNNLRVLERGREARSLTPDERQQILGYLSGPLGIEKPRKSKANPRPTERPKATVNVGDLRELMGWSRMASKTSQFRFNIEHDSDRTINTDWFSREIVHGAVTPRAWQALPPNVREGINRAILKYAPEQDGDAQKLKSGVMSWAGLSETQADALVAAWTKRPKPDAKRLNMSRRAVRNILRYMENAFTCRDRSLGGTIHWLTDHDFDPAEHRWLTQIEARKAIAEDDDFRDATTGEFLDDRARQRYATGAKGATARDRHYIRKHLLRKNGEPIFDPDGLPLHVPPPAPMISNPVVRKAIHEVRRHLVEYMIQFGRKPDYVCVELAREARMGKIYADRLLSRNRLRNRIRNDIARTFALHSVSATQQRAAVDRVVLAVQQSCICPLCGQTLDETCAQGMTLRKAATGEGCEVAHIIPRASGGHNGLSNIVLSHTKCNRDMGRRTPRQFWEATLKGGFAEGIARVDKIYADVDRPKASEVRNASGNSLWACYFTGRDNTQKIEQFKKDVKDIQQMTPRQEAATKYAARQVMAYLADALFDGTGLPERGGERRVFTTDGFWTSRLRREWGLFFDPHQRHSKGLTNEQEQERKEKDRGDHRHHAIDAVIIALGDRGIQLAWDERERSADRDDVNTADEAVMENYRRNHPLAPPKPFRSRDEFRDTVRRAVFGDGDRPICHRPVKRKITGALHEETLFGPVIDQAGNLTANYTARKSVLEITPNHLRMPRPETKDEAIDRLAIHRQRKPGVDAGAACHWAKRIVSSTGFTPAIVDPPPGKSGIVRDVALRARLRECLIDADIDPDSFSKSQIKNLFESGGIRHKSGVPIRSVVLLRTMTAPVVIDRQRIDYTTGARSPDPDPASKRAYVGGNNHHVEIRVAAAGTVRERWTGVVVPAFEAAQRKLAKLQALKRAGVPKSAVLRALPKPKRMRFTRIIRSIELDHPIVDRRDDESKGGRFIMSLCEGEMLWMKRKPDKPGQLPGPLDYFVIAKLERRKNGVGIVLVPHWDARAAGKRKDAEGNIVPNSGREQFTVTPSDLKELAPPGEPHAVKVRVSPLGDITRLVRD